MRRPPADQTARSAIIPYLNDLEAIAVLQFLSNFLKDGREFGHLVALRDVNRQGMDDDVEKRLLGESRRQPHLGGSPQWVGQEDGIWVLGVGRQGGEVLKDEEAHGLHRRDDDLHLMGPLFVL